MLIALEGAQCLPGKGTLPNAIRFWLGSYGLLVKIDHGQYVTYYGHLSRILVNRGERVGQGDPIARVGSTGRAYGSHLHFEVERNGRKLNPVQFLARRDM